MKHPADSVQFWDTSAIIPLIAQERHTPLSKKARQEGRIFVAWSWLRIEAYSALARRNLEPEDFKALNAILEPFEFLDLGAEHHPAIEKSIHKHRLPSADAGHLHCLKLARKVYPSIRFVCMDAELSKAADTEGIETFG